MKSYGQYCPVARAAEILGERWTLLILRDLLGGARRFNDIRRGVPHMSPSLLSKRLKHLEAIGLLERHQDASGIQYRPTAATQEVRPIIELYGAWGQRWVRNRLGEDELDVSLLMWFLRCGLEPRHFKAKQSVVKFEFTDQPRLKKDDWWADEWWLIVQEGEVDLCVQDPGHEIDLYIVTDLRTLTKLSIGDLAIAEALADETIELHGSRSLAKSFDRWLPRSGFATIAPPPEPMNLLTLIDLEPASEQPAR